MSGIGVWGKHEDFGDFVSAGLSERALGGLSAWLDRVLPESKAALGAEWEITYDRSPPIRFWIGGEVFGTALCGVMKSSRDKVGRRFPLVFAAENSATLPPVLDPEQAPYDYLLGCMERAGVEAGEGARALLKEVETPRLGAPVEPALWASNPSADVSGLLADVSTNDHLRAAASRSYWWTAGDEFRASAVQAGPGMPDAEVLIWFMRGIQPRSEAVREAAGATDAE